MPNPVDMATLHLNLSSNSSSQQRLDILLQSAEQMPQPMSQRGNVAPDDDPLSIFSGPLGDQVSELNEAMRQYGLRFELSELPAALNPFCPAVRRISLRASAAAVDVCP